MILKHTKKNGRIRQLLGASVLVLFCCFYSNPTLAYDQQYTVGGTGPNGGVVTSVAVTSEVTGTSTSQVGDNLETITTNKYTETVVENVTTTNQITQTVITVTEEDKSTGDIIVSSNLNQSNSVADVNAAKVKCAYGDPSATAYGVFYNDPSGCGRHTTTFDDLHVKEGPGSHIYTTDMDNWMTQEEMNYGFSATANAQIRDSYPNTTDPTTFTISLKLYDPDTGANTIETNTWNITHSNHQTYSTTLDITTNTYGENSQLIATYLAQDPSWTSQYGNQGWSTDVQNFNLILTYDVIESVVQTINQTIVNSVSSALETIENDTSLVYSPIIQPGTDTNTTTMTQPVESFEVEIASTEGSGMNLEFTVEVDETAGNVNVEMASTNLETGVVTIDAVASISLDFSSDSGGTTTTEMQVEVATVEASVGAQVGGAIESAVAEATTEMQVAEATTESTTSAASEVSTSEGNNNESSTQENVSESESSESTETSESSTENVQESSENAEQPVESSNSESEESAEGDTDADGDSSESEADSETEDTGNTESDGDKDESSSGGEKSEGKDGDSKSDKNNKSKNNKSKSEKKKIIAKKVEEAKQKIATKILAAMADTYSAINETTKIALISSLTDTKSFKAYLDKQNSLPLDWYTDVQVYQDMPMLLDPAGILYDMAQDKIMDEMIMMQYDLN